MLTPNHFETLATDPKIKLTATCVRVPVFVGRSEAVNIEFESPMTADHAREILREAPSCMAIETSRPTAIVWFDVGRYIKECNGAVQVSAKVKPISESGGVRK